MEEEEDNTGRVPLKSSCSASTDYVRYRVFGYSVTAAVHLFNVIAMALALRGPIMNDPDIAHFYSMEFFYLTIWNYAFQIAYVGIGLACDIPVLLKLKNTDILNSLRSCRIICYNGLIWPVGVIIFIVFWPVYIYDRNLVFPDYIDKVLSQVTNYILHMFILYPILWDLFFLPHQKTASRKHAFFLCTTTTIIYIISIFALYAQRGVWPYPVLKMIYGTIYFPSLLIALAILQLILYYIQWPLISWISANIGHHVRRNAV